eukprot:796246-Pleurochrysis_carterae.AAC.2
MIFMYKDLARLVQSITKYHWISYKILKYHLKAYKSRRKLAYVGHRRVSGFCTPCVYSHKSCRRPRCAEVFEQRHSLECCESREANSYGHLQRGLRLNVKELFKYSLTEGAQSWGSIGQDEPSPHCLHLLKSHVSSDAITLGELKVLLELTGGFLLKERASILV